MESLWIPSGPEFLAASLDLPALPPPWPVALLVHGFTANRIGRSYYFVDLGRTLAHLGVACLRFDQSGCGESTGDHTAVSLRTIERDSLAVYQFLARDPRFDPARLVLIGASMGSFGALAIDAQHGSRGLALLAPVFDLDELVRGKTAGQDVASALRTFGFVPFRGLRLGPTYFENISALSMPDLVRAGRSPALILHTQEDETVSLSHAQRLCQAFRAAGRQCDMPDLPGSTHDFHEEPWRTQSITAVSRWFSRCLAL